MNTVNISERLPPPPIEGQIAYYPVVYKPAEGHHKSHERVGWDGKNWHLTEGVVVVWVDPKPIEKVEIKVAAPVENVDATYAVSLTGFEASKKIGVIKIIRELTGLPLGDAKAFVEAAPKVLKTNLSKVEATELTSKLVAVGAVVESKTE